MIPPITHKLDEFSSLGEIKNHKWNDDLASQDYYRSLQSLRNFIDTNNSSLEDKATAIRIFFTKKFQRTIYMKKDIEIFHQYHQYKMDQ